MSENALYIEPVVMTSVEKMMSMYRNDQNSFTAETMMDGTIKYTSNVPVYLVNPCDKTKMNARTILFFKNGTIYMANFTAVEEQENPIYNTVGNIDENNRFFIHEDFGEPEESWGGNDRYYFGSTTMKCALTYLGYSMISVFYGFDPDKNEEEPELTIEDVYGNRLSKEDDELGFLE